MERLPGTPYLAGEVMGRGPHGAVLVGRDALDRKLAIKVLTRELSGEPETAREYAGQRDALLSVRHPHLMPVYDILPTDAGVLAIVTDRAEGGNLRQALEVVRTFPPSEACRLGAQLARALAALHSAGLVHGDLVATNILFNDSGSRPAVRLSDAGLTRWLASLGRGWVPAGAVAYAAPEVAAGGVPGPPADLYGLGVLLHEMCVGAPPFTGDAEEVMRRHVEEVPIRPAGVPDQLWVLIAALLAKDGPARVGPAAAVAGYLDAIAADVDRVPPAAPIGPMAAAAVAAPLPDLRPPAAAAGQEPPAVSPTDETDVLPVAAPPGFAASDDAPWTPPPPAQPAPWERPVGYEPVGYEPGGYEPGGYEPVGYEPGVYEPAHDPVEVTGGAEGNRVMTAAYLASHKRRRRQQAALIAAAVLLPVIVAGVVIGSMTGDDGEDGEGGEGVVQDTDLIPTPALPGDLETPTPSPSPSATPTPTPSPTAIPEPTPTPDDPDPTPTPRPTSTATPTPTPTPTPSPVATESATASPSPSEEPTSSATATPTSTP